MTIERAKELIGERVRIKRNLYALRLPNCSEDELDRTFISMETTLELKVEGDTNAFIYDGPFSNDFVWLSTGVNDKSGANCISCWVNCHDLEEIR